MFIIAKNEKQSRCPPTGEWINKTWYSLTMEYFSAIKSNNVLVHVTVWLNLKNTMPRESSSAGRNSA